MGRAASGEVVQEAAAGALPRAGFPAGRPRPAPPRPGPPRVSAVCADGWGSFSPTRQPAPACRASGPWSPGLEGARALSPPWAGAPAAPRSALCEPEDWHLGRRCPAPCQTWFCEVSAGIA